MRETILIAAAMLVLAMADGQAKTAAPGPGKWLGPAPMLVLTP